MVLFRKWDDTLSLTNKVFVKRAAKISLIVSTILILVVAILVVRDLRYPPEWDKIHLGMPRSEVENLIGRGVGEWPGWSGPYWEDRGVLVRNELNLYIDPVDGVTIIYLERFSIIPGEHRLWNVRAEYAHSAAANANVSTNANTGKK